MGLIVHLELVNFEVTLDCTLHWERTEVLDFHAFGWLTHTAENYFYQLYNQSKNLSLSPKISLEHLPVT